MDFKTEKKGYNRSQVDEYIMGLVRNYEQTAARQNELIEQLKLRLSESEKKNKAYRDKESLISQAITSAVAKADEIDRLARIKYTREMEQLKAFHDKWLSYYDRILKKYPLDGELASVSRFNDEMNRILEKARNGGVSDKADMTGERTLTEEQKPSETTRIGYTLVDTDETEGEISGEGFLPSDFDPVDRIRSFLTKERGRKKETSGAQIPHESGDDEDTASAGDAAAEKKNDYADRSPSGFSFEEALNPKEDLAEIMRDLGLLLDE